MVWAARMMPPRGVWDHSPRQSPGGTITVVPYDEVLVDRIRNHIGNDPALAEKKMFGGLAFLIQGNMRSRQAARAA